MTTAGEPMAQTESLHIRVPQGILEELDQLAGITDRSRNRIVTEAIEQYLDVQRWQVELIRERLAEAESGNAAFVPHDEVMERQEKRLRKKLGL
jgi:predicted transcriptional regulator